MTACMGAGWLMGPFLGNALFKVRYRQQWGQIAAVSFSLLLLSCFFGGRNGDVVCRRVWKK